MFLIKKAINAALRSAAVLEEEMLTMACVAFLQRCWDIWAYSAKRSDTDLLRIQIVTIMIGLSSKHQECL